MRTLTIDFNQYTDGDPTFKKELISLLINDIRELRNALQEAVQANDPEIFERGRHKTKTTIEMVNDVELQRAVEGLKGEFAHNGDLSDPMHHSAIAEFNRLTGEVVETLSVLKDTGQ